MKLLVGLLLLLGLLITLNIYTNNTKQTGAPPTGLPESEAPDSSSVKGWFNWERPEGPARVGLQVGHWKNDQLPDELRNLRGNTGAQGGGKTEAEVNLAIAESTRDILETRGVVVDIIPTVVPPKYWADAFIAIHADGSNDSSASGYKVAAPWRDMTGSASTLVSLIEEEYSTLGLVKDPNITKNMRGYYAFSWWRFEHAIHPMTTAAIVETGFLTNPSDRKLIVDNHQQSAQAIADGILRYLESEAVL